ncbi:MAG: DUF1997 domain-containing protein [Elainellaceae cyanobacterium]
MFARFQSSQTVDIAVPEQSVPIQHYLRQPHRVIRALVDPKRTESLARDVFRLKMRPLSFLILSIQPTVDMKLWADSDGTIHLKSVGCKIHGVDFIDQRFNLTLAGELSPIERDGKTHLVGRADLQVEVNVPPPLEFTPRLILERTGNGLLGSVLMTIKQRLMHQLIADYRAWVKTQTQAVQTSSTSALAPDQSLI